MGIAEPFSPDHLVLIVSAIGANTRFIEQALHQQNIAHCYAKIGGHPLGLSFLWDLYHFNPDMIIVYDEKFPDCFMEEARWVIRGCQFGGLTLVVTPKPLAPEQGFTFFNPTEFTAERMVSCIERWKALNCLVTALQERIQTLRGS